MVSPPLQEFTIAVTGNFGEARTTSKMKQWIKVNGGKYAWEMSSKVMYLICSKEHFKKNVNMGKCGFNTALPSSTVKNPFHSTQPFQQR